MATGLNGQPLPDGLSFEQWLDANGIGEREDRANPDTRRYYEQSYRDLRIGPDGKRWVRSDVNSNPNDPATIAHYGQIPTAPGMEGFVPEDWAMQFTNSGGFWNGPGPFGLTSLLIHRLPSGPVRTLA